MKIHPVQFALLFFTMSFPAIAANPIPIGDIDVSVEITEQPKIIIEKCNGERLNNISLKRSLKPEKRIYHAQTCVAVKVRRVKGGGGFRVWQQQPLILQKSQNKDGANKAFSPAEVRWGDYSASLQIIPDEKSPPLIFYPTNRFGGWNTDTYTLDISAKPPVGSHTAGLYQGVLSLIFETES
ncbi:MULTISPECIES: fimbrial protein [Yersinia]|uniref:fimbrial protein n=1 Tax=Yersinia TaxID=629 RepID=UPI000EB054F6|nr:fimbrial protein [Yersinia sp. IP36721]